MAYKMNGFSGFGNSPLKHKHKRKHLHLAQSIGIPNWLEEKIGLTKYWDDKPKPKSIKAPRAKKVK